MDSEASALKRVPAIKALDRALQSVQVSAGPQNSRLESFKAAVIASAEKGKKMADESRTYVVSLVKDPQFQRTAISTGSGALVMGSAGGAFGAISGVFVGGAAGVLPALLTFGLSIPVGAFIGGVSGLVIGASTGTVAGGTAGCVVYKYRVQIKEGVVFAKVTVVQTAETARVKVLAIADKTKSKAVLYSNASTSKLALYSSKAKSTAESASTYVKQRAVDASTSAKAHANAAASLSISTANQVYEVATSTCTGVSVSAAAASGLLCGVAGGVVGTVAGGLIGVVPALFTFGLSIPVGAAVGLCAGATTVGSAGAVGGGLAGFAGFTYKNEIRASAQYIHAKALDSAANVKQNVRSLVTSGTGGTSM
jgi:hypothetical protein